MAVKTSTVKNVVFAKGGSTHMHAHKGVGPQKCEVTSVESSGSGPKFLGGGSTHMAGKGSASPQKAGRTSVK